MAGQKVVEVYVEGDGNLAVQLGELPEGKKWTDVAEAVMREIIRKEHEEGSRDKTYFLLTGDPVISIKALYRNDMTEGEKWAIGEALISYGTSLNPNYECHQREDWDEEEEEEW